MPFHIFPTHTIYYFMQCMFAREKSKVLEIDNLKTLGSLGEKLESMEAKARGKLKQQEVEQQREFDLQRFAFK